MAVRAALCRAPFTFTENLHPVIRRLYAARMDDPSEAHLTWSALAPFADFRDMAQGARRVVDAICRQESILVAGDYDADGATSTAVLVRALRSWGGCVDFVVPDRLTEGYGLTPALAGRIVRDHDCALVITVDNGIASHEGVSFLKAHGIDTVITDHHLPGQEPLPDAVAVINPRRADETIHAPHLAGVGVAFGLAVTTRAHLLETAWAQTHPAVQESLAPLLDLVALGTVADVVSLDRGNRLLVDQGLRCLRSGHGNPGIQALVACAKRPLETLTAEDLAFAVGPRLNAAGRLSDMRHGIQTLLAPDFATATPLAQVLHDLNIERRALEEVMRTEAVAQLPEEPSTDTTIPEGLDGVVVSDPSWHEGVVGLVAGRLKDRLHRPVMACAPSQEAGLWKASVRSIPGINIRDVLAYLDQAHPGLILRFGGHAAAAGLTFPERSLARLPALFASAVSALTPHREVFTHVAWTDGPLSAQEMTLDTAYAIRDAGPWGAGFPAPLFEGDFEVTGIKILKDGLHAKLTVRPLLGDASFPAIAFHFQQHLNWTPTLGVHRFYYALTVNTFNHTDSIQLRIDGVASCQPEPEESPLSGPQG